MKVKNKLLYLIIFSLIIFLGYIIIKEHKSKDFDVKPKELILEKSNAKTIPIINNGYIYYIGDNNNSYSIYKLKATLDDEPIPICSIESIDSGYCQFITKMNNLYFSIHYGGGVMGEDHYYKINNDDTVEKVIEGNVDFIQRKDSLIVIDYLVPPSSGNIYITTNSERKNIGNELTTYGWQRNNNYKKSNDMFLKDNWLYTTGSNYEDGSFENNLFKINIDTNKEVLVSSKTVIDFKISSNFIYLLDSNNTLCKQDINDNEFSTVTNKRISNFNIDNDGVYFVEESTNNLYYLDINGNIQSMLLGYSIEEVEIIGNYILCSYYEDDKYGSIVMNKQGKIILKIGEKIHAVSIDNNILLYTTYTKGNFRSYYVTLSI